MNNRKIYWHLPGFCSFRLLNQLIINLMRDYPEKFRENYQIGSVYGTFPGAIWNGGRAVIGKKDIENILLAITVKEFLYGLRGPILFLKRSICRIPTVI